MKGPMKISLIGVFAALTLLLTAGSAFASNYCLGESELCIPAREYPMTAAGLQAAVDDASSTDTSLGHDDLYIAKGTIELGEARIDVNPPTGESITIIGAGIDKTIFHSTTPDDRALDFFGSNAEIKFSDATVQIEGTQISSRHALHSNSAELDRVKFEITSTGDFSSEGFAGSGTCRDCEFALSGNGAEAGYADGNMTIHRSEAYSVGDPNGTSGFRQQGGGVLQLFNSTISNVNVGLGTDLGTIVFTDSLLDMGDFDGARGVVADNANNGANNSVSAFLYSSTVVGTGANQKAVSADARTTNVPGENATLYLKDSILLAKGDSSKDIVCTEGTNGNTVLTLNFLLTDAARQTLDPGCSWTSSGVNAADGYTLADVFVNPDKRDFRLKPAPNPALDTGNTSTICDDRYDLLGNIRCINSATLLPQDGKIDVGAVEYQNYAPDKPVLTAPSEGMVGDVLAFSVAGFDANGDAMTYKWNFGDGSEGTGSATTHVYAAPGKYLVQVIANDGTADSVAAAAKVTIAALPVVENPVVPNSLALAKASGKFKFKAGAKLSNGFKSAAKKPKTAFVLATANTAISGTIKLYNAKGKALKGSQKITLKAGKTYLTFGGKWNKKALPKGKYTLKFTSSSLKDAPKSVLNVVR